MGCSPQKLCVFWYALDARNPNVIYSVQKISLVILPVFKISTQIPQSYGPAFTYDNIQTIKSSANKFCQESKNLDDFAANLKQILDQIIGSGSFKIFVVASQYNGLSTGLVGDVYAFRYYGFMPRYCKINGSLISTIFF